jgi:hypothetical protein
MSPIYFLWDSSCKLIISCLFITNGESENYRQNLWRTVVQTNTDKSEMEEVVDEEEDVEGEGSSEGEGEGDVEGDEEEEGEEEDTEL